MSALAMGGDSLPLAGQARLLMRRTVRRVLETPANYMPGVVMPLLLIIINSQSLQRLASTPGFPAPSYLDFVLVLGFVQAALVATSTAGLGLATDIETGFASRMSLSPMHPAALVIAQVTGATVVAAGSAVVYLGLGLVAGVRLESGVAGALLVLALAAWSAIAFSLLGCWLALRSGGGETLQSITPLLFAGLFLSTVNMPRSMIEAEWFLAIASVNPVTYLVEGMRSLVITGWDPVALLGAIAVLLALTAIGWSGCARAARGGTLERIPSGPPRRKPPKASDPTGADARTLPSNSATAARAVAWRHLRKWFTVPSVFFPSFALPLIFFLGFAGPLGAVRDLPGFDYAPGYVSWIFAFALVQSCMYGGVTTGFAIAIDFRTGFARRVMLSVADRRSILLGFVLSTVIRGAVMSAVITVVAFAIGLELHGSPLHIAGMYLICWTMSIMATLWAAGVMLRARDPRRAPTMQIPLFVAIFVTPVFAPLDMLAGWLHVAASINPITYLLTASRELLIGSTDGLPVALVALAVACSLLWWWAATGMRSAERSG